ARPETVATAVPPGLRHPAFDDLGVVVGPDGGTLRVWSGSAESVELVVFDDTDLDWITETLPLVPADGGVWEVYSHRLRPGTRYAVRVDGPHGPGNTFNRGTLLIEPYTRGLVRSGFDGWRSVVVDGSFDWGGVGKPAVPLDRTVIYEGHLKGLSKRHPGVPGALRGTYAGLAHPAMVQHFLDLGVTSIELLPVHAFATEPRLLQHGLTNYWGYNSVNFFTPHAAYATEDAQREGPEAVLREFKGMVKLLHEAGLEVILDVVYNHTSEEGLGGPRSSLRGIDNRAYYRQQEDGAYIDVTGCGNSVNTSTDAAARLVLDSLRYWAEEVRIDGFRFDLAATLGRDRAHTFTPDHPLLRAIVED
ncbi:alpha-amylase family glycosyl hydrolase, partial [Streptomyces albidoflavus]